MSHTHRCCSRCLWAVCQPAPRPVMRRPMPQQSPRAFRLYASFTLAAVLGVILWGAYVRATGAGAGCGQHWPVCNGTVIPRAPSTQTLIEYTHRVTSGLSLLLVIGLYVWARLAHAKGHTVRR